MKRMKTGDENLFYPNSTNIMIFLKNAFAALSFFAAMCIPAMTIPLSASVTTPNSATASKIKDGTVTVYPEKGEAKVIRLQVVNEKIIRVRATSEDALPEKKSLIIVPQKRAMGFNIDEDNAIVTVSTNSVKAVVNKVTGKIEFFDATGKSLLKEAGKSFKPFTVPEREIGAGSLTDEQRNGLTWHAVFDSPDDEAFYGLGQHQSEELNMKGRNEDLFQYNTKVSTPFVISNRNYGLLWDSYSYCRFGSPEDYMQLDKVFNIYGKDGTEGHLTGTYTDRRGRTIVRNEDSIYFEYDIPGTSEIGQREDKGGIRNLPQGFPLEGSSVVYEGFIEAPSTNSYQFILYYAGYIKVYVDGKEAVAERWRTAWNPNTYKFECKLLAGKKSHLRIEWKPDGGVSYCGLRVARPRTAKERGQLSIWSEMSRDMDYYFIAGNNMDDVISGYRTLTGKAPVYPKWVMGYWQSRERYKTAYELVSTLAEFRRRKLPIDNIVQDWFYWREDQWGSHEFDAERFPDPVGMIDSVHTLNGRYMISVWPKFYENTDHFREFDTKGWMYRQAVTDNIRDWVGKGYVGSFYDAYSEGARKLFWQQMNEHLYKGLQNKTANSAVDAWWMDASEPNVRDCTPMWYRKALCGPTALGSSTEYFNAYSLVNADAIYNGQRSANPDQRVFLLTRSGFTGLQRYSTATWSGDIGTRWEDMRAQMTAGMNYSLSGLPFWGMDAGGFCVENRYSQAQQQFDRNGTVNADLDEWRELQTRWNQFACFVPIYRAHGQWPLREPWNIAPDNHPAYKSIEWHLHLRYRLMPYLYSMAGWVHLHDYTMMRALVMDFNSDPEVHDIKDQWMFGPSLMACPVSQYKARNRSIYLPEQRGWYNLHTGQHIDGGQHIVVDAPYERMPVFAPEGSILPVGPEMQWSDEMPADTIDLYIYGGKDAKFQIYEDEGTNYNYEKGKYATIDLTYDDAGRTLTISQRKGAFKGMLKKRTFNIVLITKATPLPLSLDTRPSGTKTEYDGKEQTVRL